MAVSMEKLRAETNAQGMKVLEEQSVEEVQHYFIYRLADVAAQMLAVNARKTSRGKDFSTMGGKTLKEELLHAMDTPPQNLGSRAESTSAGLSRFPGCTNPSGNPPRPCRRAMSCRR